MQDSLQKVDKLQSLNEKDLQPGPDWTGASLQLETPTVANKLKCLGPSWVAQ